MLSRLDEQQLLSPIKQTSLAPRTVTMVPCKASFPLSASHSVFHLIEEQMNTSFTKGRIFIPRTLITRDQLNRGVSIPIVNPTNESITLNQTTKIAHVEALNEEMVLTLDKCAEGINLPKFPSSSVTKDDLHKIVEQAEAINEHQKEQLLHLLQENQSVFCRKLKHNPSNPSVSVSHSIPLIDTTPVHERPRRQTHKEQEVTTDEINKMLDQNVIQFSTSPWAAPVQLIPKKDGSIRFCIDYRKLNAQTKKDVYPLPRIDDILDSLGKARIRSKLDLTSGYWQIPVNPVDREKTAFVTRDGLLSS